MIDRYKPDWDFNPIGIYLMSCYAYEKLNSSFISDRSFDMLGVYIDTHWKEIHHRHKKYINPAGLTATSSLTVGYHELPLIVLMATHRILKTDFTSSPIYELAMREAMVREFI